MNENLDMLLQMEDSYFISTIIELSRLVRKGTVSILSSNKIFDEMRDRHNRRVWLIKKICR